MQTLLKETSAYSLMKKEEKEGRLNHAYLILMDDPFSLRAALTFFARVFFGVDEPKTLEQERISDLIEKESFGDCLFFPKKDKKFSVSDVDEIKEESALNPVEGDKKLFVIGDFSELGIPQQNKLLKLLEEPPKKVYFLLGATVSHSILQTVLSRAKKLEIPPFSTDKIVEFLKRNSTRTALSDEQLYSYAAASGGFAGNAKNALEGGYFTQIQTDAFSLCLQEKSLPILARKIGESKYKKELLSFLRLIFRDALLLKTGNGKNILLKTDLEKIQKVSKLYTPTALLYAQEAISAAEKEVKFNANFTQCLEICFGKIYQTNEKF